MSVPLESIPKTSVLLCFVQKEPNIYVYIITHRKRHETQHINVNYRLKFRKTQIDGPQNMAPHDRIINTTYSSYIYRTIKVKFSK